jgi:hypothetical protein
MKIRAIIAIMLMLSLAGRGQTGGVGILRVSSDFGTLIDAGRELCR